MRKLTLNALVMLHRRYCQGEHNPRYAKFILEKSGVKTPLCEECYKREIKKLREECYGMDTRGNAKGVKEDNMGIRLSRKFGVNPHLTKCPRCGGDGDTIVLSGWAHKYECGQCHQIHIGLPENRTCSCGSNNMIDKGEPPPEEKFNALCSACEKEVQNLRTEIAAGGVPFQCSACHCEGVIRGTTEFAKTWKAEHGKAGVDFAGNGCPMCEKGVKREISLADSDKHTDRV